MANYRCRVPQPRVTGRFLGAPLPHESEGQHPRRRHSFGRFPAGGPIEIELVAAANLAAKLSTGMGRYGPSQLSEASRNGRVDRSEPLWNGPPQFPKPQVAGSIPVPPALRIREQ